MAIDELSNLKTLRQLEKERLRVQESAKELEERAKVQEYRLEQAKLRMQKIVDEDRERCKKTAALLKEFEQNSCKGPFFDSLLDILLNFQGDDLILLPEHIINAIYKKTTQFQFNSFYNRRC